MYKILKKDPDSRARVGILETLHGIVETPTYVVVGTHAEVRTLKVGDLERTGTELVIVNTYHMWQKLGDEGLKTFPGLHSHMNWQHPLMTDSGGFQVFSFGFGREHGLSKHDLPDHKEVRKDKNLVSISEDGVYFSAEGGPASGGREFEELYLDAEKSIKIQEQLGADIIFAFDEPTSPRHDHEYTRQSLVRTHSWEMRSLKAKISNQLLYGIVQGGTFEDLRKESAAFIARQDFDGFAIGGSYGNSFGGKKENTFQEVRWTVPLLPEDKPRHLLGIGLVEDLFLGVEQGIDTFDCVVPTREARHGSIWTSHGRIDIKRGFYAGDKNVLDDECACLVCTEQKLSRAELYHLFKSKNPEAGRLATIHNISFFNGIMEQIRDSIKNDNFQEFKNSFLATWK